MSLLDIRIRKYGFKTPILSNNVLTADISNSLTDLYEITDDNGHPRNDIAKYLDSTTPQNQRVLLEQNMQMMPPRSHNIDSDEKVFDSILPRHISEAALEDIANSQQEESEVSDG